MAETKEKLNFLEGKNLREKFLNKKVINIFLCILFLIIFIVLIFVREKVDLKIDLTRGKIYSLSKENKEKIKKVENQIYVIYPGDFEKAYIKKMASNLKKENKNIKFSDKMPDKDFNLSKDYIYIMLKDLNLTYSISPEIEGRYLSEDKKEYKYLLEDKLVNAILDMENKGNKYKENKEKILKVEEENEKNKDYVKKSSEDIENEAMIKASDVGLAITSKTVPLKEYQLLINKIGLKAEKLFAAVLEDKIPDNIKILIIPALNEDITENMYKNLMDYAKRGGNFFIANGMTNIYELKTKEKEFPNFLKFINEYGITANDSYILKRQDLTQFLKENKDIPEDEVEANYFIKADPIFEDKMPVKGVRKNNEKTQIFLASPIKILEGKENTKVNVLAKTSNDSIEIKDIKKFYNDFVDSKVELLEKQVIENLDEKSLNEIYKKENATEEEKREIEEIRKKDFSKMYEERKAKLPELKEDEFNIAVEAVKTYGNMYSKMIYLSSDEIFYGKTSLNHENKTPPPLLNVSNQRLVFDIYEYLKYGDFNIKVEDSQTKYVKQITKEEDNKEKTRIYIISGVIFIALLTSFNLIKTLKMKDEMLKDIEEENKKYKLN